MEKSPMDDPGIIISTITFIVFSLGCGIDRMDTVIKNKGLWAISIGISLILLAISIIRVALKSRKENKINY